MNRKTKIATAIASGIVLAAVGTNAFGSPWHHHWRTTTGAAWTWTPRPTQTTTPAPSPTTTTPVPSSTSTSPTPSGTSTSTAPTGKTVVFSAPFSDSASWTLGHTSSYPPGTPQTNPGDNKLDHLRTGTFSGNRLSATLSGGVWTTDLLTTEGTTNGFQAKAGDQLDATVTLYSTGQMGSWPAIWTWKNGGNEVDAFEYHPDNPNLLELTNHTGSGSGAYVNNKITPGVPFNLSVKFLTTGVQWYVNGNLVFTGNGVPSTWSAYLIVNISVCAGQYHPAPNGPGPLYMDVTGLKVYR